MNWNIAHRSSLTVIALSFVLFAGADWTRFRGPDGSGVSDQTGLPTTWSATENVAWKTALPGFGSSSPIVVGEKIFLTCYSGYGFDNEEPGDQKDLLHHVTCIDRGTGEIIWDKSTPAKLAEQDYDGGRVDLHGYASATPVSDGKTVFAFFGKSGVCAYTLDGELLWRKSVGTGLDRYGWGSGASPILAGDLVIVNGSIESQSIVALQKSTGEVAWRASEIDDSWSTPLLVDLPNGSRELVVSMKGLVRGYDPATGRTLWECKAVKDYVCPAVIAHKGVVYISGGRRPQTLAIKAGGRGDVTDTHIVWEIDRCTKVPTPLYHEGQLYWVCDGRRGPHADCFDAATGKEIYSEGLTIRGNRDKIYASVVLADGKLYAVSRLGGTIVYAVGKQFKELARNDLGDDSVFNATPTITGDRLLLRSDKALYCIGK